MYEVVACEAFERWYESLAEADAEAVTSAVDVLAELGPALGPPRTSELLLWFDGTSPARRIEQLHFREEWLQKCTLPSQRRPVDPMAEKHWQVLSWRRRALSLFESQRFRERIAALDAPAATLALRGVEQVRSLLAAARQALVCTGSVPDEMLVEIGHGIDAVLGLAGLELSDPGLHEAGLRELGVEFAERCCRVIYGIDARAKRILVISGEPLHRFYYGDAVRAAEARWTEYLASEYLSAARGAEP